MGRRHSIYPGGPQRGASGSDGGVASPVMLRFGHDAEVRRDRAYVRKTKKGRRRRMSLGLVLALLAGASLGSWVGANTKDPEEEVARQTEAPSSLVDLLVQERRRIIKELWAMEALERVGR